jgi:2-polyprenyl-3-methyl-5-hydroxy-6-metoxy-1,4-benzoquinol methylase
MISSMMLPRKIEDMVSVFTTPTVPRSISENFREVTKQDLGRVEASLRQNYFSADQDYLSSDEGQRDLQNHLSGRLDNFRNTVIPWLNSARALKGASILEIGCGTGSSTIALAEQGATVTAIDILETSLSVARERCQVYGLRTDLSNMNATEVHKVFFGHHFDFIIFFAALEHMTHDERMIAMNHTWNMLSKGDLWCVIETPNRLWYYDGHTSLLPLYNWLPDELAFKYSQFSPRQSFRNQYREISEEAMRHFLRRGRGVSFHEFELTMDRANKLDVVSSLPIFLRRHCILRDILWRLTTDSRYVSLLARIGPKVHQGFYQKSLDLIIRKS